MKKVIFCSFIAIMMAACESPYIPEADGYEKDANVTLHLSCYQQEEFTRAAKPLTDQCARLSVAIFKQDGAKIKNINQMHDDDGFGTIGVSLPEGIYKVVAIAHSSTEGNATITSTEKVTFANNKMTDTFCYCGTLEVGEEPVEEDVQMLRVVAMVRLTVEGNIPDNVARFKFYYTGGSSTLNPSTGYGCVNSKQTEYRSLAVGDTISRTFELYTAPHEQNDVLKIVITAQGNDNSALNEWTMENVPITRNKITAWQGKLFNDDGSGGGTITDGGFTVLLDTEWDGTINYTW